MILISSILVYTSARLARLSVGLFICLCAMSGCSVPDKAETSEAVEIEWLIGNDADGAPFICASVGDVVDCVDRAILESYDGRTIIEIL